MIHEPSVSIALLLALGAAAQWLSWRVNLPAILPLLLIGFAVGPLLGWVHPLELIGEDLLYSAVGLAVGLILFEGGLTLRLPEVKEVRRVVFNLITVGGLITWLLAALTAWLLLDLSASLALLFGSLVLVTGPTVIGPLMRSVRAKARVANILKWEGILIDPLGALVAVLILEFLLLGSGGEALGHSLLLLVQFLAVGTVIGLVAGVLFTLLLRRHWVPDYLINLIALALVFGAYSGANLLASESGLLAATVMGLVMANLRAPNVGEILAFKEDLSLLFISLLFIVLAANIELEAFLAALSWKSLLLVGIVMFVIRPINIFVSTARSPLTLREKLFLSWIAPRGIVAAAVTSLFASRLTQANVLGAEVLVPLVFIIIVGTVTLNSLSAKAVAKRLGVAEPEPQGFFILGAHPAARQLAAALQNEGFSVLLSDTNYSNVTASRLAGLEAYYGSPLAERADDAMKLSGLGKLLALTSNDEANALAALKFTRTFGSKHVYQLKPDKTERNEIGEARRGRIVFGKGTTFREFETQLAGGDLKTTRINQAVAQDQFFAQYPKVLPLFILRKEEALIVSGDALELLAGDKLMALVPHGEPFPHELGVSNKAKTVKGTRKASFPTPR